MAEVIGVEKRSVSKPAVDIFLLAFSFYPAGLLVLFLYSQSAGMASGSSPIAQCNLAFAVSAIISSLAMTPWLPASRQPFDLDDKRFKHAFVTLVVLIFSGCLAQALFPGAYAALAYCIFIVSGILMPWALACWCRRFSKCSPRSVLLNASLAFVAMVAIVALVKLLAGSHLLFAIVGICTLAGALPLLRPSADIPDPEPTASALEIDTDLPFSGSARRILTSAPLLGMMVFFFTTGVTRSQEETPSPLSLPVCCVLGALVALAAIFIALNHNDHVFLFVAFEIAPPVLLTISLIFKLNLLTFISETLMNQYMYVYWQLLMLMLWPFLVTMEQVADNRLQAVCGLAVIGLGGAFLIGAAIQSIGGEWPRFVLSFVTAIYYLYSIFSIAQNFFLYIAKPSEKESESYVLDTESACRIIGNEHGLSPRETEVLVELAQGHTSSYISKVLFISSNTVRTHMKNLYRKLGVELARRSPRAGRRGSEIAS